MYLHLGQNEIVADRQIIGIFDLDKCSSSLRTREYLAAAEQEGVVLDVSGALPKSFVVCDHPYHTQIVYLSQLNPSTLQKRAESRYAGILAVGFPGIRRLRAPGMARRSGGSAEPAIWIPGNPHYNRKFHSGQGETGRKCGSGSALLALCRGDFP